MKCFEMMLAAITLIVACFNAEALLNQSIMRRKPSISMKSSTLSTIGITRVTTDSIIESKDTRAFQALVPPVQLGQIRFLIDLWRNIASPDDETDLDSRSPSDLIEKSFRLTDYSQSRQSIQNVLKHFQTCKDCAADDAILLAEQDDDNNDMLTLTYGNFKLFNDDIDEDGEAWEDIPDFDDSILGPKVEGTIEELIFKEEHDDEVVIDVIRNWVTKGK